MRRQLGLDEERETEESDEGSKIRDREKMIGGRAGPRFPRLDERARCAEQDKRQANRRGEQDQNVKRGVIRTRRREDRVGSDGQQREAHDQ